MGAERRRRRWMEDGEETTAVDGGRRGEERTGETEVVGGDVVGIRGLVSQFA